MAIPKQKTTQRRGFDGGAWCQNRSRFDKPHGLARRGVR
jgi:hypothetical protein